MFRRSPLNDALACLGECHVIDQEKSPAGVVPPLLVSGFDNAYVWPWMVHIFSGQKSSPMNLNRCIAITPTSLSVQNRELLEKVAEWLDFSITWIKIELPDGLPLSQHITVMAYARLVLADSLDSPFIWMDVDTLLRPGWEELLYLPELPSKFASRATLESLRFQNLPTINEAILRAGNSYFNSGIIQINPEAWRSKGLDHQWKVLLKEYKMRNFQYLDQCILNYLLVGLNEPLPAQFNFMPDLWEENSIKPRIIHFVGMNKPWMVPSLGRNRLLNSLRGKTSTSFRQYWNVEKELIAAAKHHSWDLGERLTSLRNLVRKPTELSLQRVSRITRRAIGSD